MEDIRQLKITKTECGSQPVLQLNYPVKEIYEFLGCHNYIDFYDKLQENGFEIDRPIQASVQDIEDSIEFEVKLDETCDPMQLELDDWTVGLLNVFNNLIYHDVKFTDETTGKVGLKDTCGRLVIPAIYDDARGAVDMSFIHTLAVVKSDDKYYLTPRFGSGELQSLGYDKISRSCSYAWVENDGKKGLLDAHTGETMIPCEMDWTIHEQAYFINCVFTKNGKLGLLVENPILDKIEFYSEPQWDAIDITWNRYHKDGKWWYLRDNGDLANYFKHRDNVTYWSPPFYYLKFEEVVDSSKLAKFDKHYSNSYPPFRFKDNLSLSSHIASAIYDALGVVEDGIDQVILKFILPEKKSRYTGKMQPQNSNLKGLKFYREDGKIYIEPIWYSTDSYSLLFDLEYPNIRGFNCLLKDIEGSFGMQFYRKFEVSEINDVEKLVNDYYLNYHHYENIETEGVDYELIDEVGRHSFTDICRLNDRHVPSYGNVKIFVFGEKEKGSEKV